MGKGYLDAQCRTIFNQIMEETYPVFERYGVGMPTLRVRDMKRQWSSCLVSKGIITLNKRLLGVLSICISYVAMHEFCHLIHPNHSKAFYDLLTMVMTKRPS